MPKRFKSVSCTHLRACYRLACVVTIAAVSFLGEARPILAIEDDPSFSISLPYRGDAHTITCSYGCGLHQGVNQPTRANDYYAVDFQMTWDEPVYPVAPGVVRLAGWTSGGWSNYGIGIFVDHGRYQSWYAHLNAVFVSVGEQVNPTRPIGAAGATCNARWGCWGSAHLHFALYEGAQIAGGPYGGHAVKPEPWGQVTEAPPPSPAGPSMPPPSSTYAGVGFLSLEVSSAAIRVGDSIRVSARSSLADIRAIKVSAGCGNPAAYELGAPSLELTWNSSGCPSGLLTITAQAALRDDLDWSRATVTSLTILLDGPDPLARGPESVTGGRGNQAAWHSRPGDIQVPTNTIITNNQIGFTNTGSTTWNGGAFFAGLLTAGRDNSPFSPGDARSPFPWRLSLDPGCSLIQSGQGCTWTVTSGVFTEPGTYWFVYQMVQEGVQWFGDQVRFEVKVR